MFKEDIRGTVEKDQEALDKLGRWCRCLTRTDNRGLGLDIPRLWQVRRASYEKYCVLTQPKSAKQPAQRPNVRIPYQKKTPPLIKWASPEKISFPRYES
jgi:hypothetical protein